MTGAVALAVILVIVVATLSLAFRANQAGMTGRPGAPGRPSTPGRSGMPGRAGPTMRPPRRPGARRDEPATEAVSPNNPPDPIPKPEPPSDLLRTGRSATAKVISVVDERTLGATTRSRITLRVEPEGDDPFDAQLRVFFSTPEKRASIKVGGSVGVRFDPDNHNKIVLDLPEA